MVAALFLWGLLARPGEDFLMAGSAVQAGRSGMSREKRSEKWGWRDSAMSLCAPRKWGHPQKKVRLGLGDGAKLLMSWKAT